MYVIMLFRLSNAPQFRSSYAADKNEFRDPSQPKHLTSVSSTTKTNTNIHQLRSLRKASSSSPAMHQRVEEPEEPCQLQTTIDHPG